MQNSGNIHDLLGLFRGQRQIPPDLVVQVLGNMPPSAALSGLGLMEDSHSRAADLNGYINSCINAIERQGKSKHDCDSFLDIQASTLKYIANKGYCTRPMSQSWKSLAVGVLVSTVGYGVNLADLRSQGEDALYIELMTIEPDMSNVAQPLAQTQALQGITDQIKNLTWNSTAGHRYSEGPFAHPHGGSFQHSPSASSPIPESSVRSPGPWSLYGATPQPELYSGSEFLQQQTFLSNQAGSPAFMPNSQIHQGSPMLSAHNLQLVPSPSSSTRSFSPSMTSLPVIRRIRHPSTDPEETTSSPGTGGNSSSAGTGGNSPAQAFGHNIPMPGVNSPGLWWAGDSSFGQAPQGGFGSEQPLDDYYGGALDLNSPPSSIPPSMLGPIPNVDGNVPMHPDLYRSNSPSSVGDLGTFGGYDGRVDGRDDGNGSSSGNV
ncbi:hypothetical protein BR93DRAFT_964131 [Coniochaeta sp. PMI_546]|nr:hypothetical protein BR93DRAFT_964131 [Coniochaeta sp. PMI_546]